MQNSANPQFLDGLERHQAEAQLRDEECLSALAAELNLSPYAILDNDALYAAAKAAVTHWTGWEGLDDPSDPTEIGRRAAISLRQECQSSSQRWALRLRKLLKDRAGGRTMDRATCKRCRETDGKCTCCDGEFGELWPEAVEHGHQLCESCAEEVSCAQCEKPLDDPFGDVYYVWDRPLCQACQRYQDYRAIYDPLTDVLYDLGWRITGASGRSEATYYEHSDTEVRIRLAQHSPVYPSSCECVTVQIGADDAQGDQDFWAKWPEDAARIAHEAHEYAVKKD